MALVFNPNRQVLRYGDPVAQQVTAPGGNQATAWYDYLAGGLWVPTLGPTIIYTPPNRTMQVTLQASDTIVFHQGILQVYGTFPVQPQFDYEVTVDDTVKMSLSEDNVPVFRVKAPALRTWKLQFDKRPEAEWLLCKAFYEYHRKHIFFYYEDLALNELRLVHHDSQLTVTPHNPNSFSFQVTIQEVRQASS